MKSHCYNYVCPVEGDELVEGPVVPFEESEPPSAVAVKGPVSQLKRNETITTCSTFRLHRGVLYVFEVVEKMTLTSRSSRCRRRRFPMFRSITFM